MPRRLPSTPIYEGGGPFAGIRRVQRPKQLRDMLFDRMCDWGYHTKDELDGWMPDRQWIKAVCDLVEMGYAFDSSGQYLRMRNRHPGEPVPSVVTILSGLLYPSEYQSEEASQESAEVESAPFEGEEIEVGDRLFLDDEGTFSVSMTQMITDMTGILARRGAGKTYLALGIAESFLFSEVYDVQWVWLDPMGIAWGLLADDKGNPIEKDMVLLGGDRGRRPLTNRNGRAVARAVMAMRSVPFVLDVSKMEPEAQHEFAADFLSELYRENRIPIHLFLDEVDVFAPQTLTTSKHQKRCLEAMENVVRRGRTHGLGGTLITQRPAAVSKSVFTQIRQLILLQTGAPHDLKAVATWFTPEVGQAEIDACMKALPTLPLGTAYYTCNGEGFRFGRFKVRKRRTFNSSYSPPVKKKGETADPKLLVDARNAQLAGLQPELAEILDGFLLEGEEGKSPKADVEIEHNEQESDEQETPPESELDEADTDEFDTSESVSDEVDGGQEEA
jgi:hypothetical protein